jgi:hypothetical protein
MAFTDGPAESIGRGEVAYNTPLAAAPADGCSLIAVGANLVFTDSPVATVDYVDEAIAAVELTSANVIAALGYTPANDNAVVRLSGDQSIAGNKSFTGAVTATGQVALGNVSATNTILGITNFVAANGGNLHSITNAGFTTDGYLASATGLRQTGNITQAIIPSSNSWFIDSSSQVVVRNPAASYAQTFVIGPTGNVTASGFVRASSINCGGDVTLRGYSRTGLARNPLTIAVPYNGGDAVDRVEIYREQAGGTPTNIEFINGSGTIRNVESVRLTLSGSVFVGGNISSGLGAFSAQIPNLYGNQGVRIGNSSTGMQPINFDWTNNRADFDIPLRCLQITRSGVYTVGTLPSASANPGFEAVVTDSSVTTNGSPVAGGGSSRVKVFSNGSTWDVVVA